jgi:hypothetical protein
MQLRSTGACAAALVLLLAARPAAAADCDATSLGLVPLTELGAELHLDAYAGGLYPNGNAMPADHRAAGLARAGAVVPRDAAGAPHPAGSVVLLSIGMSNTTMEWCSSAGGAGCASWSFTGQALGDPAVNHASLVIADGAAGGQVASTWTQSNAANYARIRDRVLPALDVTPAQVQVAWVKLANPTPLVSLPADDADAFVLQSRLGSVVRALRANYPNLALVFLSSRIYAGYADTTLNPEPFAYESGFAVKWLIEAQIRQLRGLGVDPRSGDLDYATGAAPWLAWAAYPWADGTTPRSDGLQWACDDLGNDGTHPSVSGRQKVGALLLEFFLESEHAAPWFRVPEPSRVGLGLASVLALLASYNQSRGRRKSV